MSTDIKSSKRAADEEESKNPRPAKTTKLDPKEEKKEGKQPAKTEEKEPMYNFDPLQWLRVDMSVEPVDHLKCYTNRLISITKHLWAKRIDDLFGPLQDVRDKKKPESDNQWDIKKLSSMTFEKNLKLVFVLLHPECHYDEVNLEIDKIFDAVPMESAMNLLSAWLNILRRKMTKELYSEKYPMPLISDKEKLASYKKRHEELEKDISYYKGISKRLFEFNYDLKEYSSQSIEGRERGEHVNINNLCI